MSRSASCKQAMATAAALSSPTSATFAMACGRAGCPRGFRWTSGTEESVSLRLRLNEPATMQLLMQTPGSSDLPSASRLLAAAHYARVRSITPGKQQQLWHKLHEPLGVAEARALARFHTCTGVGQRGEMPPLRAIATTFQSHVALIKNRYAAISIISNRPPHTHTHIYALSNETSIRVLKNANLILPGSAIFTKALNIFVKYVFPQYV